MEYFYLIFLVADVYLAWRYMRKDNSMKQKLLASAPFVLAGVYLLFVMKLYSSAYAWLIVGGLVASFAGDYLLGFDLFGMKGLPGIASFALAHILYISAFVTRIPVTEKTKWLLIPWAIAVVCEVVAAKKLKINFGKVAFAVLIYAMIIDAMVILGCRLAILSAVAGGVAILRSIILFVGVIMFIISDAGVCMFMFAEKTHFSIGKKIYSLDSFNIVTYYGGQMLIAASVLV